jgi:hypothetical protein
MSGARRGRVGVVALAAGAALLSSGCKPQRESPEDHTVRKLQEAMKAPPMMATPPNQTRTEHLANLATGQQTPGERTLSGTGASVEAGPLHYQLTRASELQSVGGGDVKITSTTPFVRVGLSVVNDGGEAARLDLSAASLGKGAARSGIAPDAQQVGGTRKLAVTIAPHASEDVVLFFEAPAAQPPFQLHLPKPGGGEVELPVE